MPGKIWIGTSGWHYSHWKGPFYPSHCSEKQFLSFYITRLSSVEINRTFYSLPSKNFFKNYAGRVPPSFLFSVKASRFITHVKRLKHSKQAISRLLGRIQGLGEHLGPILFQLPPHWNVNPERLSAFVQTLPKGFRYAFEFRDPRWFQEDIYEILRKINAAICIYDFDELLSPRVVTANFIYVRLHGPAGAYAGKYSKVSLKKWADFFQKTARKGLDVYCYFDNDEAGFAPINAMELNQLL